MPSGRYIIYRTADMLCVERQIYYMSNGRYIICRAFTSSHQHVSVDINPVLRGQMSVIE